VYFNVSREQRDKEINFHKNQYLRAVRKQEREVREYVGGREEGGGRREEEGGRRGEGREQGLSGVVKEGSRRT
jgi:hypothetical protein